MKALEALFHHEIDDLGILPRGAEGAGSQGLGFPAGEEGRAVHPGKETYLDGNGPDLLRPAAVHSLSQLQNGPAHVLPIHVLENGLG